MKLIFTLLLSLLLPAITSAAIITKLDAIPNSKIFGIEFSKGKQAYYGQVTTLSAISLQNYYTDLREVQEISIDMRGATQVRIYSTSLIDPDKEMTEAANVIPLEFIPHPSIPNVQPFQKIRDTVDGALNIMVYKEYPVATHAMTIEFKLKSHKEVINLFKHLTAAWSHEIIPEGAASGEPPPDLPGGNNNESNSGLNGESNNAPAGESSQVFDTSQIDPVTGEKEGTESKLNGTLFIVQSKSK